MTRRVRNMSILLTLVVAPLIGCVTQPTRIRPVATPQVEEPAANLPAVLHQRNWKGSRNQGSCVHASLVNHLRWLNLHELAQRWKGRYSDGEWESRLRKRLDASGIAYLYTVKADPRFLDWADATRRGAILWWKPDHCCTFAGWVHRNGRQYAAILDSNYPGSFEITPREQFARLWAGYGGFALTVLEDPATSIPDQSIQISQ